MSAEFPAAKPRVRRPWLRLLQAVLLLVVAAGVLLITLGQTIMLGAEAYLYGYPLVITDVTRVHTAQTLGPENQLQRVRRFPDASFKGVVRPNVDTLYTTAFIDMAQGPWVFDMAANRERYALMPFMDAWTNVFATPGTRTTGTEPARFLLVGPAWRGLAPEGMRVLRAPTRIVWLIGRTQANGAADYPLVHRLQDGLKLWRLAEGAPPADAATPPAPAPALAPAAAAGPPPVQQMLAMPTVEFFTRLAQLMVDNPPAAADGPMLLKLARIGIAPGTPPAWGLLDRWSVGLGRWLADLKVARELRKPRNLQRGWATPPAILGAYGTEYNVRAVVAMVGLGANLPEDAIYPNTQVDVQGAALHGNRRYRLHFNAGELPPVQAFWSVTAYGADDYLIDHPAQRYAIGDRDPLVFNADGSLDLWIQADPPEPDKRANWLPVKADAPFLLNARLYWPKPEVLRGTWGMPAVEPLPGR